MLLLSLPPHPSSLRVRAWRRLRALGAVPLKNSVYVLPLTPGHHEQFQWLAQEVQRDGGDATLLAVDRIESAKPVEAIRLFQETRHRDYADLARRYRKLLQRLDRRTTLRAATRLEARRLARNLERVIEIDFFRAPGRPEVERLREVVERRLRRDEEATPPREAPGLESLRGRRWVTRPRPHVDRIASAWLIKRFIDPEAEFLFAAADELPAGAIAFDVLGAEFGHHGQDVTFETLLRCAGLTNPRLAFLAEIVHEADLHDAKFDREEAPGLDLAIRGLLAALKDDHEVLAHGMTLFDGLYATIGERT